MSVDPVYIISSGRVECKTAKLLNKIGYTGPWRIVVSNDEADNYRSVWGGLVVGYDYESSKRSSDMMDNFDGGIGGAAPARNGALDMAANAGESRIWMLDDDITAFTLPNGKSRRTVTDGAELFSVFRLLSDFAESTGIGCVGGVVDMQPFPPDKHSVNWYVRQVYNISVDSIRFRSRMEEDLCYACDTYRVPGQVCIGFRMLGFKTGGVCESDGGNTELYNEYGDIRRAAYNVLTCPTTEVRADRFGYSGFPKWRYLVPKVIREVAHG